MMICLSNALKFYGSAVRTVSDPFNKCQQLFPSLRFRIHCCIVLANGDGSLYAWWNICKKFKLKISPWRSFALIWPIDNDWILRVDNDPGPFRHRLSICKTKVRNDMFRKDERVRTRWEMRWRGHAQRRNSAYRVLQKKHVSQPPMYLCDRHRRTSCPVPLLVLYVPDLERSSYVEASMF